MGIAMDALQSATSENSTAVEPELLVCMVCAAQFPSTSTYQELDDLIPVCTDRCRRMLTARLTSLRNIAEP
jgi:hypothetical protein